MHEVKDTLDRHLNIEVEPSPAIRAVYGERLPWLQMLDRKWAEANTERILPKTEPKDFWHAAWDTYICYCAPYDNVFDWLEGEYVHAIEQIGTHDHGWYTAEAPDYQLAHHLMTFYWRGRLNQELLASFFNKADEKLRRYSVEFVGRSLRQTKGPIAGEILDRLKDLWAMRLNAVKQQPTLAQELQEYGWWFASGKFDEEWSVNQLVEALQLARWIEPDHLVVEWLADLSETMPAQAIVALAMVVEGDAKGWGVSSWGERAKDIIRAARRSGNRASCQKAEDIVNLLGSRGYFDFGELLKERI
jgi:hypothetical protein